MAHQHPPRFLKIVDDAKSRVRETNVDAVKKRIDHGEKFLLVDVREESEFAKDRLPGSIHLGKGVIERDVEQRIPDTAAPMRSARRAPRVDASPRTTSRSWSWAAATSGRMLKIFTASGTNVKRSRARSYTSASSSPASCSSTIGIQGMRSSLLVRA